MSAGVHHIVILSEEPLFCEALSDAVSRELGAEVTTMESPKSLENLSSEQVDLVISTISLKPRWQGRHLHYSRSSPRKITAMLADIAAQLAEKPGQPALSDKVILQEKARKLERMDTGSTIELTEKEQALLLFIKEKGEASREEILKNVWGFADDVTTHTLETHVYRLRQKWRELADSDCIVATVGGYRWYDDNS